MKKVIVIVAGIVELLTISSWLSCRDFTDFLNLSSINLTLHLDDLVHTDKGIAPIIVRIFHNKLIDLLTIIFKKYLLFWDIRFLMNVISIIGYVGTFSGLYYLFSNQKKKWYHWVALVIVLLVPFIQIIFEPHIQFVIKLAILFFPYCAFSLYGIWRFLAKPNSQSRFIFVFVLLLLSVWWLLAMKSAASNFCVIK